MTISTPELQDFKLSNYEWAAVKEMSVWLKVVIMAFVFEESIIGNLYFYAVDIQANHEFSQW